MRESKTLSRLKTGKVVRICGLGHFLPSFIRHAAHFGFDCIWLDLEHRSFDYREVQALLAYCHLYDIDCLIRPPTTQPTQLYRYLEDGAAGLMIPHVATSEEAREIVDAIKFPPLGNRGVDGAGLDSDFMLHGGPSYPGRANEETFLLVQIESPQAVDQIDSIAAVSGVDGLFIGPGDLGLRLGNEDASLSVAQAIEAVAVAATQHKKAWGCPMATVEEMRALTQRGAQLVAHGNDFVGLKCHLEAMAGDFENADIR
ncbi:HpcH/HpaI aldolase family protein [Adhaeretor mobilis]|uniref:5-keto-4-deoxy-D-glucarate aldolase n=1 Tax=Adhaeretor mobilis TaxID=1930276 RepID=A0A517MTI6_9BACT|nr:aldolase/citrate lyase family protein [Adhaeretor mobilis]QDS98199.1 5-keto-4-deoxy-D-glucarate aldolase [Adhaeretor mobilis]